MEILSLPQSWEQGVDGNKIPKHKLLLEFDRGNTSKGNYLASGPFTLFALLGVVASVEKEFLFEIKRLDLPHQEKPEELPNDHFSLLGYFFEQKFIIFDYNHEKIEVHFFRDPKIDFDNLDLVELRDCRWDLGYFIPKSAFMNFEEMTLLANDILQAGKMPENHMPFSQRLPDLGLPNDYIPKWCDYDY